MSIATGTVGTRTDHQMGLAVIGVTLAVGFPAAFALIGILAFGWDAISWAGALAWGVVGAIAFTLFSMMGKAIGMTRMDLLDLLGSMFVTPGTGKSRALGAAIHLMNGSLLGVSWAYTMRLMDWPLNWMSGLAFSLFIGGLALIFMSSIGAVHPAIRGGTQKDPGFLAMNFGALTPLGSLMGHAVFGIVLGILYQNWPLG